jgi:ribulose-bisphosphate carboxylase large chain
MTIMQAGEADVLLYDADAREDALRDRVTESLAVNPPAKLHDAIVGTYFFVLRSLTLVEAATEICYHATSAVKHPPSGSLLEECTAWPVRVDAFDRSERVGLVQIAFPLKMMLHPDGHVTSTDVLHTLAPAIVFDVYENQDARLIDVQLPDDIVRSFPGPAYGPVGVRERTGFALDQPAFGTILKPTAGITPTQVEALVAEAAHCRLFMLVKEDEDLYPDLDYSPVVERTRRAVDAIRRAREERGELGLIFAPHITGAPHEILDTVERVLEAGASGVMFSETWAGGAVRMVREATKHQKHPPAIYGHNAGIGVKTRSIWREVIDLFARLDGIDFRQTAPVRSGTPYLKPYGREWEASESTLTREIPGIKPTMIVRAGGLDQGNILLNLADVERRGLTEQVLFLAGSAINSVKDARGIADPKLGAQAMVEALQVHRSGELVDVPAEEQVVALSSVADRLHLSALREALRQRYPVEDA